VGSELLTDAESSDRGDSGKESPFSFSEMFEECFPYYMSLGMTYDEYWNGDPSLVRHYRKAYDLQLHRRNWEYWLQGRYVYDAIMRLIPSFNPLKPKEPIAYMEEPYAITEKDVEDQKLREEKQRQEAIRNKMMAFAAAHNRKKEENHE
jgi:hypothetical protein